MLGSNKFNIFSFLSRLLAVIIFVVPGPSRALEQPGEELSQAGLTTKLGEKIDLGLSFSDEHGSSVRLQEVIRDGRPFIVVPAYYHCPRMCGLVLKGVKELVSQLELKLNEDYRIITVSFDTADTAKRAQEMAESFHEGLAPSVAASGWRFLTGQEPQVSTLMNQIGFHYTPDRGEFANTAAIMILTPDGQISQYFTGITFSPRDVKLALVEAGRGSIGTAVDHFLLF